MGRAPAKMEMLGRKLKVKSLSCLAKVERLMMNPSVVYKRFFIVEGLS